LRGVAVHVASEAPTADEHERVPPPVDLERSAAATVAAADVLDLEAVVTENGLSL
jgi:hypothetical protein